MDEFRSRTGITPVDRPVVRAASSVPAIKPVDAGRGADGKGVGARAQQTEAPAPPEEDLASIAEFVEVHARVSAILSDIGSGAISIDQAADQLIPRPIVLVPLPPASREAVEHAETVAKRIVERASYALGAHAKVSRGAVEHIANR